MKTRIVSVGLFVLGLIASSPSANAYIGVGNSAGTCPSVDGAKTAGPATLTFKFKSVSQISANSTNLPANTSASAAVQAALTNIQPSFTVAGIASLSSNSNATTPAVSLTIGQENYATGTSVTVGDSTLCLKFANMAMLSSTLALQVQLYNIDVLGPGAATTPVGPSSTGDAQESFQIGYSSSTCHYSAPYTGYTCSLVSTTAGQ